MRRTLRRTIPVLSLIAATAGCDVEQPTELDALGSFRTGELITREQWQCVMTAGLGLRSGDPTKPDPWKGPASYAMAEDEDPGFPCTIPITWDERLEATAMAILGFGNSAGRRLYINYGVRPLSDRYQGSFRKDNSNGGARGVLDSFELTASTTPTEIELWVAASIPEGPDCGGQVPLD